MKIIDYAVFCCATLDELESKVKDAIFEDWQPLGGIVTEVDISSEFSPITGKFSHNSCSFYLQAIVKYE